MIGHKDDILEIENYVDRADAEFLVNEKWRVGEGMQHDPESSTVWKRLILGLIKYLSDNKKPKKWAPELMREYLGLVEWQLTNELAEAEMESKNVTIH
jgi:hypothetical protein